MDNIRGVLYHSYRDYSNGRRIEGLIKCHGSVNVCKEKREGYKYDGYFMADDPKVKSYRIVSRPGILYNGNLWLAEEDDELARSIFVAEAQNKKEELMNKIQKLQESCYSVGRMAMVYRTADIISVDELDSLYSSEF